MDEDPNNIMADTLITGTTIIESSTKSDGDVPVGGVIAWLSNITGVPNLPIGWKLCDGTVVNDALSPMNGETIPDLNGDNRFLRGSDTAGGTGGTETHAHVVDVGSAGTAGSAPYGLMDTDTSTMVTSFTSTLPTYFEVVWIIRIR